VGTFAASRSFRTCREANEGPFCEEFIMVKLVRIDANGRVVDGDRRIHVTSNGPNIPAQAGHAGDAGGPDQVKRLRVGNGQWEIHFRYDEGSPFTARGPFDVPGPPATVSGNAEGTFKYDVRAKGANPTDPPTDDPDVIVD
jgi:hypothetical protein